MIPASPRQRFGIRESTKPVCAGCNKRVWKGESDIGEESSTVKGVGQWRREHLEALLDPWPDIEEPERRCFDER